MRGRVFGRAFRDLKIPFAALLFSALKKHGQLFVVTARQRLALSPHLLELAKQTVGGAFLQRCGLTCGSHSECGRIRISVLFESMRCSRLTSTAGRQSDDS